MCVGVFVSFFKRLLGLLTGLVVIADLLRAQVGSYDGEAKMITKNEGSGRIGFLQLFGEEQVRVKASGKLEIYKKLK